MADIKRYHPDVVYSRYGGAPNHVLFEHTEGDYVLYEAYKTATNLTRDQKALGKFYNVETKDALIAEQAHHIVKLQEKLAAFDTQAAIRKVREG